MSGSRTKGRSKESQRKACKRRGVTSVGASSMYELSDRKSDERRVGLRVGLMGV